VRQKARVTILVRARRHAEVMAVVASDAGLLDRSS
jgi:hypothetical protein